MATFSHDKCVYHTIIKETTKQISLKTITGKLFLEPLLFIVYGENMFFFFFNFQNLDKIFLFNLKSCFANANAKKEKKRCEIVKNYNNLDI